MEGLTFQQAPFTVLCVSGTQKIFQSPKKARAVISQKKKRAQICKAKMYLVNVSSLALDASNKCKKYSSALWWPLTHMIYNTFLYLKSEYKTKIWECCLPFRLHFSLFWEYASSCWLSAPALSHLGAFAGSAAGFAPDGHPRWCSRVAPSEAISKPRSQVRMAIPLIFHIYACLHIHIH